MKAYIQYGTGSCGPFLTESADVIDRPIKHHMLGLPFTATGYGSRIPTRYMVSVHGKWRRVYCRIYSNIGTLFIGPSISKGRIVNISEYGVHHETRIG